MSKRSKPIKQSDITASYVICAVSMLVTIVCWFLPTMEAKYRHSGDWLFGSKPSKIVYTFFSFNDSLPLMNNILNLLILACSIASLVLVILRLVKKKVMSPSKSMLFPTIFYFVYYALFLLRYETALHKHIDYSVKITPVTIIYLLSLFAAFAFALGIVVIYSKLKKQQAAENTAA